MATKKNSKAEDAKKKAEKDAKRKARMEALKNRPAEQRPNSKQIDVIELGDGKVVKNYGYPIKSKTTHVGVLVTSVVMDGDKVISESVTFVPGNLTVKAKKGHGTICSPKAKKENSKGEEEVEEVEEEETED